MVQRRYGLNSNDVITARKSGIWPIRWWEQWRIYGGAGDDRLTGGPKPDRLYGEVDNDILYGGGGNDLLDGGSGIDEMHGGQGDDRYIVDDYRDQVIESSDQGNDRVQSYISYTLPDNIERLDLLDHAYRGTGNNLRNTIVGNPYNNHLDGGQGADYMYGGNGHDTYRVDDPGDVVYEYNSSVEEVDKIYSTVNYSLGNNVENLTLMGTAFSGQGNDLNNSIIGNNFNNALYGRGGHDRLYAWGGNDIIRAGTGSDHLNGGSGNDQLYGGDGNDTLIGGLDNDILVGVGTSSQGNNERDILYSGSNNDQDIFILGAYGSVYYNDNGDIDYAVIRDFDIYNYADEQSIDKIQLAGSRSYYSISNVTVGDFSGSGIYFVGDLISIIEGVSASSLNLSDPNQFAFA
ncbi:calcium-binding protein [Leptothoe spongobia]|uniref:Calcium-binding protein n=1 Tax=Leptothoe spongobia TAU-MAC 1115 TaxID=1967444 RepID=A0A947DG06_9CYAN|nr:calcium-binding protein [Leptothoe spongobia]MBT9316235.1 hypothetical protein [Leptothoe spongobia TAU-MAC 1115]